MGGETASVDFSFGNVMRCMCFTRDDPMEPKKQLSKISTTLEDVAKRLSRIESASGVAVSIGRRHSSLKSRKSVGSIPEQDEKVSEVDEEEEAYESDEFMDTNVNKIERDDEINPYWIEDERLKTGSVEFLSGGEIVFWKEMIKKYLTPLEMTEKEKREQKRGLEEYRDVIIFTFLFTNSLYIVGVTMLQTQTDIFMDWTLFEQFDVGGLDGIFHNITYKKPETSVLTGSIDISRTVDQLDFIGLFFLLSFSSITICQMVGMIMHRWQTLSHYISSTEIDLCRKKRNTEDEAIKLARDITMKLQNPEMKKTEEEQREIQRQHRRDTIAQLNNYHDRVRGGEGEEINLEKEFKKRFESVDLTNQDDPMMKRLQARRDTIHTLAARHASVAVSGVARKKSVSFRDSNTKKSS